jgi:hypothetical protein
MSRSFKRTVCAVGALIAGLLVAEGSSRLKAVRDTTLLANGVSKKPPTTSTGRELTGPGAHHEEYIVPQEDTGRVRVDTVRDRRLWINEDGDTLSGDTLKRVAPPKSPPAPVKPGTR